jgi:hypothetical protein
MHRPEIEERLVSELWRTDSSLITHGGHGGNPNIKTVRNVTKHGGAVKGKCNENRCIPN